MTRLLSLLFLSFLLLLLLSLSSLADSHFEGFEAEEDDVVEEQPLDPSSLKLTDIPLTHTHQPPPPQPAADSHPDPAPRNPDPQSDPSKNHSPSTPATSSSSSSFDYWDEDEFEGLPSQHPTSESPVITESATGTETTPDPKSSQNVTVSTEAKEQKQSYTIEIACVSFLIIFVINYFTGKDLNDKIALAWAGKFATKDTIFDKNFSLVGVGNGGDDSPLLLKEGQNVFKFYASGRRYCQGLLATMELKSRHDLIFTIYNMVVPCKDEISFEVYMNDDAMDHIVFAVAKKKAAKTMHKEASDLQRFASILGQPSSGRKWVSDELAVISESKEVAGDLITDAVLDQVFGEKAFEKFGKGFISMHFSDQHPGTHKKVLCFRFALPDKENMSDMTRLVALVPYYIDLIGRYKLSSQARSKTEAARVKAAQEAYKELQSARQEALQKKKAERKKLMEEAEAKLSAEAIRKKEAKDRARQMRKAMPKIKMNRA